MSHNLFFALWPDDDVRERIASAAQQLKKTHAPRGRWIKPHRYHLTLRYLGEHAALPDSLLAACHAAGDAVRAASFRFALDTAASFANRKIPVVARLRRDARRARCALHASSRRAWVPTR